MSNTLETLVRVWGMDFHLGSLYVFKFSSKYVQNPRIMYEVSRNLVTQFTSENIADTLGNANSHCQHVLGMRTK